MAHSATSISPSSAQPRWASNARFATVLCLTGLCCDGSVFAGGVLPQGGQYVAGSGTINGNATSLTINQSSSRGVIDWNSFSIGNGNHVTFNNGNGATLNRVTGGNTSFVLGTLSATGSVYLIDQQGIVVGKSGVVSTGGRFVASTLGVDNTAFMQGGALTFSGASTRRVVNLGRIGSTNGDVFLISPVEVDNYGTVAASNGTAELAAGKTVLLQDSSSGQQLFVLAGSHGNVVNRGPIVAAQVSLQAADGNVFALAGNHASIRAVGTATRQGHVWLVADTGTVTLAERIEARNGMDQDGTVDTRAGKLMFVGTAPTVLAGVWNIATPSMRIGYRKASAFVRSLNAGTSINLQTTGAGGQTGDVVVASNLDWTGDASLTLGAYRNLTINAGTAVKNTGGGNLTLRADATGIDNGGSVLNKGTLDWSQSTGAIGAFYDMNGGYQAGTQQINSAWAPGPYSGLRTQSTAYKLVNSLDDLQNVSQDLAGNYALGRDIDASATSTQPYIPIGNTVTPFTGQFDGQGHQISSLTAQPWFSSNPYDEPLIGMFGEVGSTGIVRNLNVEGTMSAPYVDPEGQLGYVGIAAAINNGTLLRVNASGSIDTGAGPSGTDYTIVGGLVGSNGGTVLRSSSGVNVVAGGNVGGLVGVNSGLIEQSFSSGTVESLSYINHGAGGLVDTNTGTITQSYSTSPTVFQGYCRGSADTPCGGAALVVDNEGTISQSFATGLVTQPLYGPIGLARTNNGTIASDVYWDKDTTTATVGVVYGTPVPATNGYTTAQMSNAASFATYDFSATGVWAMPAGATHPILRWQLGE